MFQHTALALIKVSRHTHLADRDLRCVYTTPTMAPEDHAKLLQEELARIRAREEELERTRKALAEEFADANDPDAIAKVARNAIKRIMPKAITQMEQLIEYAESESVRASLARFVIAAGLDKTKFEDSSSSELKELLKQLAANDPDANDPDAK